MTLLSLLTLAVLSPLPYVQSCSLSTSYKTPSVAEGYTLQLLTNELNSPRHIVFDPEGNLLVSGDPDGIIALLLDEDTNGCITVREKKVVIENGDLDLFHGLSISADGKTIYASSSSTAYSWTYDPSTLKTSNRRTLITGMLSGGHITRTLLSSPSHPDILLVSRGSQGNLDYATQNLSSGRSMIKAFNTTVSNPQDFTTSGTLLGWGLRNSVGIGEDANGGIWSVENSADQIERDGVDIHEDNPAEELNFHGYLNTTITDNFYIGPNYGYPNCLAVWAPEIPNAPTLTTGAQFALSPNTTFTDATCAADFRSPRLSFQAHMAPLDIKFHPETGHAWIPFHGSWNRDDPVGYKLSFVRFGGDGQPVEREDSRGAVVDVVWNGDLGGCEGGECVRPVGVAFGRGRVWVSSDTTGEVFVVSTPEEGAGGGGSGSGGGGGGGGGGGDTEGGAGRVRVEWALTVVAVAGGLLW